MLQRDARLEPPDDADLVVAVVVQQLVRVGRGHEERDGRRGADLRHGLKRRRHDADDVVRLAVEGDGAADDRAVPGKPAAPQRVGENHHVFAAWSIFLGTKRPAQRGLHAEHREVVPRDGFAGQLLRRAGFREALRDRIDAGEAFERLRVADVVHEVGRRHSAARTGRCSLISHSDTSRSGATYGSGRSMTASTTLKTAVLAPMPSASVATATAVKPGDFRSSRSA